MRPRYHILAFLWVAHTHQVLAQTVGNCPPSEAESLLEVGNVVARVTNNGLATWKEGPNRYEVPKGSGHNAVSAFSFHLGVEVGDEFRIAATAYGDAEFWAGPLPQSGLAPDSLHCVASDRIWDVRWEDIERYRQTGQTTEALESWPYLQGAPVADGDGISGNYDLAGGDIPAILGDQTVWWIMNDRGNQHRYTGSEPTGLVVRAEAFAFATSGIVGNSTFYRFAIENPTADSLSVYAGIFLDGSSGAWGDEFAGTDTSRSMVYLYGGDDDDGLFGPASPALGATILKAPTVGGREGRIGASHIPSDDGGRYGWPTDAAGYHNFVRGLIQDGSPVREGGGGGGRDGPVTTFGYPGDPVSGAFWSMVNSDGSGTSFSPVGQEMFIYAQPFTLPPGGSDEMVFALAWAQGANRFDSIVRLRDGVDFLRERRNALLHSRDGDSLPDPPAAPDPRLVLGLADNAPNPFGSETLITASIPIDAHIRLEVFDSLGRSVGLLQDGEMDKGRYSWLFYGADLAPGVYFYRLSVDSYTFSKPMVVAR